MGEDRWKIELNAIYRFRYVCRGISNGLIITSCFN